MNKNQECLVEMGVSSVELDRLVEAARAAGALGAKLSGGGRGGNMIALVDPASATTVQKALEAAGAVYTLVTKVGAHAQNE
jgi:mevalonate kinase